MTEPTPVVPEEANERVETAQLLQVHRVEPDEASTHEAAALRLSYATIAAALGVLGLVGGLFVLWMLPAAIGAVVFAELARRQGQRTWQVRFGFVAGIVGIVFAGVWVIYYFGLLAI